MVAEFEELEGSPKLSFVIPDQYIVDHADALERCEEMREFNFLNKLVVRDGKCSTSLIVTRTRFGKVKPPDFTPDEPIIITKDGEPK